MSLKYFRKTTASPNAPQVAATPSIVVLRDSTQRTTKDSALQRFVTHFLHPIALQVDPFHLHAQILADPLEQIDVEAHRLVAFEEFERRELQFGAGHDLTALLDVGER